MLITRYLFKNLLTVTLFVAVTLAMVIWLTQSLKLLELVANSDAPPILLVKMVALTLPRFLEIILPLSLVIAILFVYHKFIMDNELIVLRASGFTQFALAKPALILAACISLIVLSLTTYVSPRSVADVQLLKQTVKNDYSSFLLRAGVFNTFGSDLTVYVRERAEDGVLTGLMIHDTRDKSKPPVTVTAKRGRLFMEGDLPKIVVYEGMRQQLDANSGVTSKLFFSSYAIEIKGFEGAAEDRWRPPSERTLLELMTPDFQDTKRADRYKDLFTAEIHQRLASPFNAVSFALVALSCMLLGAFNRRGQGRKVLTAIVIILLLQAANLGLANSAKKNVSVLPLLHLAVFMPSLIGFYVLSFRGEQMVKSIQRKWRQVFLSAHKEATA